MTQFEIEIKTKDGVTGYLFVKKDGTLYTGTIMLETSPDFYTWKRGTKIEVYDLIMQQLEELGCTEV